MTDDITERIADQVDRIIGPQIELLFTAEGMSKAAAVAGRSSIMKVIAIAAAATYKSALAERGFVIVPREPTEAMLDAGTRAVDNERDYDEIWQAMIDATPGTDR